MRGQSSADDIDPQRLVRSRPHPSVFIHHFAAAAVDVFIPLVAQDRLITF